MHLSRPARRKSSGPGPVSGKDERGMLLVEIVFAMVILAVGLLALAAASGYAARMRYYSRTDVELWAAVHSQADSLSSEGYANLIDGSATVQGHQMNWTVTGAGLKTVVLRWERPSRTGQAAIPDSLIMYFRPSTP